MKKQQKETIQKEILLLEEETQNELLKLKELKEETRANEKKHIEAINEENEKQKELFKDFSLVERIEWKKAHQKEFNESIEILEFHKKENQVNGVIKNILDSYLENIFNRYAYKIHILLLENIKNNRDFNDFLKFFDYFYNEKEHKYIYNNICRLYKGERYLTFNFNEKSEILPFNDSIKRKYIYTDLFAYNYNKYGAPAEFNQDFINDMEAVKKEIEEAKKIIKNSNNKIDDFIYNYYDLKKYINNINNINDTYNEKIKTIEKEKNEALEEADLFDLKGLILRG